ncbi:hypothetical protein EFP02_07285 [Lactiplantibacillus plantarum]|uniref:hypothetical protein n=1 Tax=Lactiplantibacillus plantarum TaxID=1590 RepID=UPI0021A27DE2|nr:hypothetical protein [Lactiplantibacillus plantarum]MCT3246854.1 hypothetical protein [Lactiplantibacillus plantarum]
MTFSRNSAVETALVISDTSSGYRNSISKGLDAVAENKMSKALTYFDNALTQKPKDTKAKAYRDQAQAYVDTNSQLKAGEVQKAVTTITDGVKIKNGAKSLDTKLSDLKTTAKADLAEYKQLDKDVTAQLKITDGNYSSDVLKQCKNIDWKKKPYLSKLKSKVNKLIKQSNQKSSSSSSAASTSSSSADTKVSAADKKEADQMRQNIVQADPDHWDSAALAQVPDSVIVAATKKSNDAGGDPGTTANMIAEQYPNIKKNGSSDSDTNDSDSGLSASDAKGKLGSLDFYNKNSSHIHITGQQQTADGWEFTWQFVGGNMGGTFDVNNDGSITANASGGDSVGTGSWK